jgi:broad specificity phosphatase PhoE
MIILVRHATPLIDYSPCGYHLARQRLNAYQTTDEIALQEIAAFHQHPLAACLQGLDPLVYCSPMPGAQRTCLALFGSSQKVHIWASLKEVGLTLLPLPWISLKVRHWFVVSRIAWLLGLKTQRETQYAALHRARKVVALLKQQGDNNIALVSHGCFLHYIKQQLRQQHYRKVAHFQQGCFHVDMYEHSSH